MVSWRIFRMKSSGSWSCLRSLILIGFCPAKPFSTASSFRLVFLAGLSSVISAGSSLRLVCASSHCVESSKVHLGVCFSKSYRLFVAFFGVISGRPHFFGLMVERGAPIRLAIVLTLSRIFPPPLGTQWRISSH